MGVRKKAICIISNSRELFLSLRRALRLSFPEAEFYFYDTGIVEKGWIDDVESPRYMKAEAGVLIADFLHDSEESLRVCRFIKYLRIKKGLQFSLIFASIAGMSDMKKRYDILNYGPRSHLHSQIPIDLSRLVNTISISIPMDKDIHKKFCKEYSEKHQQFYEQQILPLLKEGNEIALKYNRSKWAGFIEDLYVVLHYLGKETPLTCHEKVLYKRNKNQELGILLESEVAELSRKDVPRKEDLRELSFLLDCWFSLVTQKNFE
jgi:hypothetical protein